MSKITVPENYEVMSYEESYDDGGFMDNSPKWLKALTIAGMVVAGLEIIGGITYCVRSNAAVDSMNELKGKGFERMGPINQETLGKAADTCFKGDWRNQMITIDPASDSIYVGPRKG